jgi:asparagine synthase (glutamine-hydrolysing)
MALAESLPPSYKLKVLDEKHVLKRAARGLVPEEILARKKQPYRAPDALSFCGRDAPGYVDEVLSHRALREAGVFAVEPVRRLLEKCRLRGDAQLSNSDNMALVAAISTQLLHRDLVAGTPALHAGAPLRTDVDLLLRRKVA